MNYEDNRDRFTLKTGIVVYIDFLGARELIKGNTNKNYDPLLETIYDIYCETKQLYFNFGFAEIETDINHKIFSDNIVICAEIKDEDSIENKLKIISEIISFVGYFQGVALEKHLKVRGAITYGEYYSNEDIVWGKALVESVELEEEAAIYPRIVISKALKQYIECSFDIKFDGIKTSDEDGLCYCDFVWYFDNKNDLRENVVNWLLEENINSNEKITAKNNWLLNKIGYAKK